MKRWTLVVLETAPSNEERARLSARSEETLDALHAALCDLDGPGRMVVPLQLVVSPQAWLEAHSLRGSKRHGVWAGPFNLIDCQPRRAILK